MYQLRGKQTSFDHKLFSFEVYKDRISYFVRPDCEHLTIGRRSDIGCRVQVFLKLNSNSLLRSTIVRKHSVLMQLCRIVFRTG